MQLTLLAILTLLCMITSTSAGPAKFKHWFPLESRRAYEYVSTQICAANLSAYQQAQRTRSSKQQSDTCKQELQCVLTNLNEVIKARMASASVLLGLTPGLLASVSPTVAEISLLSIERPILSIMLGLGSPAVFPSRVLKYKSAAEILDEQYYDPSFKFLKLQSWRMLVSAAQYILALASIANVVCTSYLLGVRTVLSWRCITNYFPLIWTFLPCIIFLPSAFAFGSCTRSKKHKIDGIYRNVLQNETDLCMARSESARPLVEPTATAIFWNYLATVLGFLHVAFGILIYSSLLLIETIDVLIVIVRYFISTAVCRLILKFEISGMRHVHRAHQHQAHQISQQHPVPQALEENGKHDNIKERDTAVLITRQKSRGNV